MTWREAILGMTERRHPSELRRGDTPQNYGEEALLRVARRRHPSE